MKTIELTGRKDGKKLQKTGIFAIVDDEDYDILVKYNWHLAAKKYAMTTINKKRIYMHRLLLNILPEEEVDHINRKPLDNRKENLRIVSHKQNMENKDKYKNNTSGYRGVHYHKCNDQWRGCVRHHGKYYRKCFNSIEEANEWVISKRKEFQFLDN